MRGIGRVIGKLVLAALLAVAMTGRTASANELTISHYGTLLQGAPYAIAMEKGFFKEAGLEVTKIVAGEGGGTTVRNILASPFPYGEAAVAAVMAAKSRGQDIVVVNAAASGPIDMFWIVKPESPIKSIADIKGKKIGYTNPKSGSDMLMRMVFQRAKIDVKDVELVATGGMREGLAMLAAGQIDVMPVVEPVLTNLGAKFRAVFKVADYVPTMTQTVGFTTSAFLKSRGEDLKKLLAARRKAVDFIYADPKAAAEIIAKTHNLKPEIAAAITDRFAKDKYWSRGDFDKDGLDVNIEGLKLVGIDEGVSVAWPQLITETLLPADLKRLF